MSYVDYNLELYRQGYRPYGETDPFAASMLNGMSSGGMSGMTTRMGPFGPWLLRGDLGQVHPFTSKGGWRLHGLGQGGAVPDGSILTYQGTWTSTYTKSPQDVITEVSAALAADGELAVRPPVTTDAGWSQFKVLVGPISPGPFNVTMKVQVTNGVGFGSPSDAASIINHYVYQVTGQMPISSTIPTVQPPGGGAQATGQPMAIDPTTGLPLGTPSDQETFGDWMSTNWPWLALAAGLVIGLPVIARNL
jgi:hypothetical protein